MKAFKFKRKWIFLDDLDFPDFKNHSWRIRKDGRLDAKINGKRVLLHRFLMGATARDQVDHIDGNPLNNSRCNLRLCSSSQNQQNSSKRKGCSCKYKGVCKRGKFFILHVNGQHIRAFEAERDAAMAYDIMAQRLYGSFSRPNFPEGLTVEDFNRVSNLLTFKKEGIKYFTSKYKGVGFFSPTKKWRARIRVSGKYKTLGYFNEEQDAVKCIEKFYE